jgi:hypothetical protein
MPGKLIRRWPNLPTQIIRQLFLMGFLLSGCRLDARVELQPCKNNIAPEKQIELGQKAGQQVYRQMPVLPDSSPATAYISNLGQKLVAQAPGYKWPYNFHVANVAEVNAFALPGGTVFVNLGTIQAAANEAQLAAVMAHEISHVVLQHSVCNAERQQKVGLIAGLGQIAAGVLLGDGAGQLAQQGIGLTAGLGFLKMSRGAEQQADLMGVGILYDAGYDPHAMAQFFETLAQKYGKGSSQFMSDHPNPGNRSEYVDKEVSGFVVRANYVTNTPGFTQIHNQVASMHAYTSKEVASGIWKTQDPNQTVSDGVNQLSGQAPATSAPDLSISGPWKTFHGAGYSIQLPGNWQGSGNTQASMFGPPGGIAGAGDGRAGSLIYGVLTDRFQPSSRGSLDDAFNALVSEMARDNPGLEPGPASRLNVGRAMGRMVDCENRSSNNGRGEHDRIVAFASRGVLRYFVFVAPSPDFPTMKPTFDTILQSLVPE